MDSSKTKKSSFFTSNRITLFFLDFIIYAVVCFIILFLLPEAGFNLPNAIIVSVLFGACLVFGRLVFGINKQIWRYGGIQIYIKMIIADGLGFVVFWLIEKAFANSPFVPTISGTRCLLMFCLNLLGGLTMRMFYRYAYKCPQTKSLHARILNWLLVLFCGEDAKYDNSIEKIKIAILGAGRVGTGLAEELISVAKSSYEPVCFIDIDKEKAGRMALNIPIIDQEQVSKEELAKYGVQEVVFAIPKAPRAVKEELYKQYSAYGFKLKTYDFPIMQTAGKKTLRQVSVEDLLFRKQVLITDDETKDFYSGKTILITGGGGSIGSEICRRLSTMTPRRLVILDIAENGAYDIQQELRINNPYLDVKVEICSITDKDALNRVFAEHKPDIVIMAAAHKHVPLMEKNCIEAVKNNVFGTLNTVQTAEKYGVKRVIMVSTDKAVNPTNVMGATKRMCEMIVQAHSASDTETTFSATRFGNVLGSAGSVIPLFRKQIEHGGPITITDKRIIRYFMTIPEASQLVLESGAMANNGELFVLDMGEPVKIYELAENMIRLSGLTPEEDIEIKEIGLRPGEKLYEELLVKGENLSKTKNELIFIEQDTPKSLEEIEGKLDILRKAIETGSDDEVKKAMKIAVETFVDPDKINKKVAK